GVPLEEIPDSELYRLYPYLRERKEIIAGFFGKENGSIHPDSVIFGMERKARELGVKIFENSRVDNVLIKDNRVYSIVLGNKEISVERVVLANGAWMREFSDKLGLGLLIEPVRKEIAVTEAYSFKISPFIVDSSLHLYFSQTLKGEIIGSTSTGNEPKGLVKMDNTFSWLRTYARRLMTALKGASSIRIMRVWSGFYEMTPDRSHIMGRSKRWPEGLYVVGGFSGHGFMLGPLAGKLIAEYIFTGKEPKLMIPYNPDRFEEKRTLEEKFVIG
ncbi:MAG: FAD-binding oxidoreductase, partial [Fervidicoccaceae archaeon]